MLCYNLIIFYMSRFIERIKLGIIGQIGVGKTHFLRGFLFGDHSRRKIEPTIAVEFYQKIMMVGQQQVSLRMWDTSGHEKYQPIVCHHLQECQVLIFMYDLTNIESFFQIQTWVNRLKKEGMDFSLKKLLFIGNKVDLIRQDARLRQIKYEQIKQMLVKMGLPTTDIYEVSSNNLSKVDCIYIHEILEQILMEVLNERTEDSISNMRVKLGAQGILATQHQEHPSGNQYCVQCNIF